MKFLIFAATLSISFSSFALTNSLPALSDNLQSVVFLESQGKDQEGGIGPGYCNGTLVGPQLIVTAAHCVFHASLLKDDSIRLQVGKYKYIVRQSDGKTVRIGYVPFLKSNEHARYLFLPSLEAKLARSGFKTEIAPEEDIAVLYLQQPLALPADFLYAKILPQNLLPSVIQAPGSGILNVVTINPIAEMATTDTKRVATLNAVTYQRAGFFESKSTSRVEPGDSGAPVFATVNGQTYWTAAVKGRGESLWSNWDAYALGVGKVCQLAKTANLPMDSQNLLCQ